jgi:ribosome maturation factor RimP
MNENLFTHFKKNLGKEVLVITKSDQLNILGQTFRPIFCGTVKAVEESHLTLDPVIIKLVNAPFFRFPTPLNIPFNKIAHLTEDFDCAMKFPLT